jgi:hypothetical protein
MDAIYFYNRALWLHGGINIEYFYNSIIKRQLFQRTGFHYSSIFITRFNFYYQILSDMSDKAVKVEFTEV